MIPCMYGSLEISILFQQHLGTNLFDVKSYPPIDIKWLLPNMIVNKTI